MGNPRAHSADVYRHRRRLHKGDADVMDFARLFEIATAAVSKVAKVHGERLDLYCTGLTPAVCAVVNACVWCDVELTCWHYDKSEDDYKPQRITTAA